MNFLYNLLELIRNQDEKINFARVVYILSRLEPDKKDQALEKKNIRSFLRICISGLGKPELNIWEKMQGS